jgi:hypothetical protein
MKYWAPAAAAAPVFSAFSVLGAPRLIRQPYAGKPQGFEPSLGGFR